METGWRKKCYYFSLQNYINCFTDTNIDASKIGKRDEEFINIGRERAGPNKELGFLIILSRWEASFCKTPIGYLPGLMNYRVLLIRCTFRLGLLCTRKPNILNKKKENILVKHITLKLYNKCLLGTFSHFSWKEGLPSGAQEAHLPLYRSQLIGQ